MLIAYRGGGMCDAKICDPGQVVLPNPLNLCFLCFRFISIQVYILRSDIAQLI